MSRCRSLSCVALGVALGVSAVAVDAEAASVIKRPGAHPKYAVELEPHLVLQHSRRPFGDAGVGVGMHASIPIIEQGPIKTINNSMGLSFGIDWAHFGDNNGFCYYGRGYWNRRGFVAVPGYDCSGDQIWFPIMWQWNFWLTDIISVYGELGFSPRYETYDVCDGVAGVDCSIDDFDVFEFVTFGGGRFMFGDVVGLNVKLGWPSVQIGASFLL